MTSVQSDLLVRTVFARPINHHTNHSFNHLSTIMHPRDVALAVVFCEATHRILVISSRKHPNLWICA